MRTMTLRTTYDEVLEATEHLPEESTLVVHEFSWQEYERLLQDPRNTPHLRVSYDRGRLKIVSISAGHEHYSTVIHDLVVTFSDELDIMIEARGRATWKVEALGRGVEADASYYVQNAPRIIGKMSIDLPQDPPPDIAVEVDLTTESQDKFPIYAALNVPEIWRYDGKTFQFFLLVNGEYVESGGSRLLPGLTRDLLLESFKKSLTEGQSAARKYLRLRLRF